MDTLLEPESILREPPLVWSTNQDFLRGFVTQ